MNENELHDAQRAASPSESLRKLLAGAVDYAGIFPPARLSLGEAVAEYARVSSSPCSWMLGRFVAPAARLSELWRAVAGIRSSREEWSVAVTGEDPIQIAEAASEVNVAPRPAGGPQLAVEAFELRVRDASEIRELSDQIPQQLECYFEVPLGDHIADCAEAALESGRSLKARTGGLTPENIPTAAALARFIWTCAESKVRFKLTAGLHHPLRAFHPLDHNTGSPLVLLHGFLNAFLAAAFAQNGMAPAKLVEILEERSPEAFGFNATGAAWRKEKILNRDLMAARHHTIASFGSCSFSEPVEGLRTLGWL